MENNAAISEKNPAILEQNGKNKKLNPIFSVPLFKQSLKSNWVLWLVLTLASALIFLIINFAVGTKQIFTSINMDKVSAYVRDENLDWLKIFGLLQAMGFNLERIQLLASTDVDSVLADLVFKIAGVLLPMIFTMITCNKLIAAQVNDGSMAYVLSTPTNRKKVIFTQFIFMLAALVAMYLVITIFAFGSKEIATFILVKTSSAEGVELFAFKTILYCVGSFFAMFALTGICFGASAFFNKSSYSIVVGGGACVICFLGCILGLFGNDILVALGVGVPAMKVFNYFSLYTLIDTDSMSAFNKIIQGVSGAKVDFFAFRWMVECGILFLIGAITTLIGSFRFVKKDLPL